MFHLDLKRAAVAIKSSRLDEAFELLTTSPERTHRDAQSMIDQLAEKYVERSSDHLQQNRLQNALTDADKAQQLVGASSKVAELQAKIKPAIEAEQRQRKERQQLLQAVSQQAAAGRFSLGKKLLEELPTKQSVPGIAATEEASRMLERQRAVIADLARQLTTLMEADDYEAAVEVFRKRTPEERQVPELADRYRTVVHAVCQQATDAITNGRLDRATRLSDSLRFCDLVEAVELRNVLHHFHVARKAIRDNDYGAAESSMALVGQFVDAAWMTEALNAVRSIQSQVKVLKSGALALLSDVDATYVPEVRNHQKNRPASPLPAVKKAVSSGSTYLLQVDGIGSLLILTQEMVTIGAANTSGRFDVGVQTQALSAALTLRRNGNDYFAESGQSFEVNGKATQQRLLQTNDTISIGERGRFKFSRPVEASGSAILQVTGAKIDRSHVKAIVLMKESLLFGPQGCHFRLEDMKVPVVLSRDADRFQLREVGGQCRSLPVSETVCFHDHNFHLET